MGIEKKNVEKKINQLESKGFTLVSEAASKQQRWNGIFEELKLFKQKHGHVYVSKKDSDNSRMGQLVHNQRAGYIIYNYGKRQKIN